MRQIKLVAIIAGVVVLGAVVITYIYRAYVPARPSGPVATAATTQTQPSSLEQAQAALDADLATLRQKGEPTQPADFVSPSVDDAENGAAELRAAAKSITVEATAAYWPIETLLAMPLAPEHADVIRPMLKESAPALQLIRSAMAKGKVSWQKKYATPMIETLLPELSDNSLLAHILRPAALLAHHDGNDMAALEHARELLFLSRAVGTEPFYLSHSTKIHFDVMAADICSKVAPTLQFGKEASMPDQLRRTIGDLLDETTVRANFRRALQGERVVQVDTALALASGKMTFDQVSALTGLEQDFKRLKLEEATALVLSDARVMLGDMARVVDASSAADLPTAQATMAPWPPAARRQPKKHPFVAMMLPSLQRGFELHYAALARRRLAATALAIRWYALDHAGQFPAQLQQLVPQYLPALPPDPMAAEAPLIYLPDQAILYSVGIDGRDDGGDADEGDHRAKDIVVPLR